MNATITLGWWVLPLVVTIAVWGWAFAQPVRHSSYMPDPMPILYGGGAIIVTLLVWLIWALFT
jgi:hypothetical protein